MKGIKITRGDIIAIAAVLLSALFLAAYYFIQPNEGDYIRVICGDAEYSYALSEDRDIVLSNNGITLTLRIKDGEAYVAESTCRDRVCVHTRGGRIVCLPAGICIIVSGGGYDFIAG